MNSKRQKAASAIALLLIFSISQIYVQASRAGKSLTEAGPSPAPARTGKLTTSGNNPINVNGNSTRPGTTILPGSQLLTPAGVGASVQIGKLGLLRMAPETTLTLNFTGSTIDVTLTSGHATLTTGPGVKGSITTPDGKTARTDSAKLSTIIAQTDDDDDDDDKKGGMVGSGSDEGVGMLGGISNNSGRAFGLIVLGGAVGAAVVAVVTQDRGNNPSPFKP
ncbi:MAG TPA: hypothetical protein VF528_15170 [Pyrinomonadaceae bacterium]|jgi:hypothetical protein